MRRQGPALVMSRRGKEKKAKYVAKVRSKKEERMKARDIRLEPKQKAALGMMAPWKRKIIEALKKRDAKRQNNDR